MSSESFVADLHMHTTESDGTCSITERVEQARAKGLDSIAITDHDRIADELDARVETFRDVSVVTGVEVRADILDTKIEILGYYIDPGHDSIRNVLSEARQFRRDRNRQIVENLSEATGLPLSYEDLSEKTDGALGRPHLAERLISEGVVESIPDAFDKYLGSEGEAYVPMQRLSYERVLTAIHESGGVASLAHPGRIRSTSVPKMVSMLSDADLDAIEVWYPYSSSGPDAYADVGVSEANSLAERHGLLKTGGSDCHGPESGKFRIGESGVTRGHLDALRASAGIE